MLTAKIREGEKLREFTLTDGATAGMLMLQAGVKVNSWDKVSIEGVGDVNADYKLADQQVITIGRGTGPYTLLNADSATELVEAMNKAVMTDGVRPVFTFSLGDTVHCVMVPTKFA